MFGVRDEEAGEIVGPEVLGDLPGKHEIHGTVGNTGQVAERTPDKLDAIGKLVGWLSELLDHDVPLGTCRIALRKPVRIAEIGCATREHYRCAASLARHARLRKPCKNPLKSLGHCSCED